MIDDYEWARIREQDSRTSQSGALRMAMVLGVGAVAIALLAIPFVERGVSAQIAKLNSGNVDQITTGSVRGDRQAYTVRHSVLQPTPQARCIIYTDGTRKGDC